MSEWKERQLGDLITFQRGHDLPKTKMQGGEYPVVGSNGIIGYHNEYTTEAPSITIGRSGNVGKPFLFKGKSWSHNTSLYIKEYKAVDPIFIFYFLQTLDLGNYAGGSAVPTLNRNHIHTLNVYVPMDISEQRKIGAVLSAIDDKIELNTAINENLEQQAQAIFNQMVKESHTTKPLSDYIKIKHGFAFKGDYITQEDNGIVLVTPGNFRIGGGFKEQKCKYYSGDIPSEYILSARDLIVTMTDLSKDGDTLGYGAFVPLNKKRTYLHNQRIGLVEFLDDLPTDYLYWYFRSSTYQKNIVNSASGSTVKHTSPDRICQQDIPIPSMSIMDNYIPILENIDFAIAQNEMECLELAELRDTLLPKLMNGKIDVSEVKI